MTGTGTKTDPFIIDNWSDFVTAVGTLGAYVEVASGQVWNMNNVVPEGMPALSVKAAEIKGNGLIIMGLFCKSTTAFVFNGYDTDFYDINLENCTITNGTLFGYGTSNDRRGDKVTFNRCKIGGTLVDSNFANGPQGWTECARTITFNRCGINLDVSGNTYINRSQRMVNNYMAQPLPLFFKFCKIQLSGLSTGKNATSISRRSDSGYGYNIVGFENCLLLGENPFPNIYIGCNLESTSSYTRYSILDFDVTAGQNVACIVSNNIQSSFINSDKIADSATVNTALRRATTSQLVDAKYLHDNGFPIGVD